MLLLLLLLLLLLWGLQLLVWGLQLLLSIGVVEGWGCHSIRVGGVTCDSGRGKIGGGTVIWKEKGRHLNTISKGN